MNLVIRKSVLFFIVILFFCNYKLFADDVSYISTPTIGSTNSGSITLTMSGGFAPYTYTWTGPGSYINNTQNIAGLDSGEYCATITDAYCGSTTICVKVSYSNPNNIQQTTNQLSGSIFPNPFNNDVTIKFNKEIKSAIQLQVFDLLGKEVYTHAFLPINNAIVITMPQSLVKGVYTFIAKNDDEIIYSNSILKN